MVDDTNKEKVNLGTVKGENGNTAVPYWVGSQLGFRLEHNPTDMPKLKDLIGETGAQGIQGNPAAIKGTLTSPNDLPTTNNKELNKNTLTGGNGSVFGSEWRSDGGVAQFDDLSPVLLFQFLHHLLQLRLGSCSSWGNRSAKIHHHHK